MRNRLTRDQATRFIRLPLAGVARVYPNHIGHLMEDAADMATPDALHPIFYGCFDWHSAVHGHWLLARCLRRHPDLGVRERAEAILERHLTPEAGEAEAAYFRGRGGFERPYGWAWLLALVAELRLWEHGGAPRWAEALGPLERHMVAAFPAYLERLTYPVRAGTHANTAFALVLALHYAETVGDEGLADSIGAAARRFYLGDRDYPVRYEPSGEDFLSAGLVEALLMARVLPGPEFGAWFSGFLPGGAAGFEPAHVSDRSDGRICHLDGLNLSRAWCFCGLAEALGDPALSRAADAHLAASLPHIDSGDYAGEHWLASFAALAVEGL